MCMCMCSIIHNIDDYIIIIFARNSCYIDVVAITITVTMITIIILVIIIEIIKFMINFNLLFHNQSIKINKFI